MSLISIVRCSKKNCENIIPENIVLQSRSKSIEKMECEECKIKDNPILGECLNMDCHNIIPENIRKQFKTRNDKRRVCQMCWRKHGTIRVPCQHCGYVITLTGYILRLNCSKKCQIKRPII
jgi:hypothetical protein